MKKLLYFGVTIVFSVFILNTPVYAYGTSSNNYSTIGSGVKSIQKSGVRVKGANVNSNISVIEYDTYGAESGYYIEDAFGMTTKYDKNGNVLSKYKTNQIGTTYVYDKYGHVAGYMMPVSKTRTEYYDKDGTPLGYFEPDSNGLIKKYDMQGNHMNTYKRP